MMNTEDTANPNHPRNTGRADVTRAVEDFGTPDGMTKRLLFTAWANGSWVSKHFDAAEALRAAKRAQD